MFKNNYFTEQELLSCDLGERAINKLYEIVSNLGSNKKIVDLGVRQGYSSSIFLFDSDKNNNKVYGVDIDFNALNPKISNTDNYFKIFADSITLGKRWNEGNIDILFVDTLHFKEHVLCELYYWAEKLNNNGYIIFHDTNWEEGKKDGLFGRSYDRVEEAVLKFFNLNDLNYENEYVKSTHYSESNGMTFVQIKKQKNFKENIKNWKEIFNERNTYTEKFFKDKNTTNLILNTNLIP